MTLGVGIGNKELVTFPASPEREELLRQLRTINGHLPVCLGYGDGHKGEAQSIVRDLLSGMITPKFLKDNSVPKELRHALVDLKASNAFAPEVAGVMPRRPASFDPEDLKAMEHALVELASYLRE